MQQDKENTEGDYLFEDMADHASDGMAPTSPNHQEALHLTVENVTKLELEYQSVEGFLSQRDDAEKYIMVSQWLSQDREKSTAAALSPEAIPVHSVENQKSNVQMRVQMEIIPHMEEYKSKAQDSKINVSTNYSAVKKERIDRSAADVKEYAVHKKRLMAKSVKTQTDWSWHTMPSLSFSKNESSETEDNDAVITAKETRQSVSENTSEIKSLDSECEGQLGESELPLDDKEDILKESEDQALCAFCHKAEKALPGVEQLASEPVDTLFCCPKFQELFQHLISEIIESQSSEETDEAANMNLFTSIKADEKAAQKLREKLQNEDLEDYISSVARHLSQFGSLFATETISFTLTSEDNDILKYIQTDDQYSYSPDDFDAKIAFTSIPMVCNDRYKKCCEIASNLDLTAEKCIIQFPDGTGQIFYPSGNTGILMTSCSPAQYTFIILEDAQPKPQIQAVFTSNGHAVCYHQNGVIWTLLDPFGGSYFNENGTRQKDWSWWDFSRHVHAPPFQPITMSLNANIEIRVINQENIYLTFSSKDKRVTFNVGSKLMVKDEQKIILRKQKIREEEKCLYLIRQKIYRLLRNISTLVRHLANHCGRKDFQDFITQLHKTFRYTRKLTGSNKNEQGIPQKGSKKCHQGNK
ncbi:hypothetical protein XENTR_v10006547 [Xenopus tropicalis]|uniref:Glutamate-rich protein 6B n=1 Tax=Xenopus tropicalis TaxID=8364 RepID=A0A8J0SRP4_XENTR|nr:glutamate-rich protein 6B [Xenopus tropicalis]KAE8626206.1 hypothetical protein XENTR_v10006547 [Xenopus tropicalis]